MNQKKDKPSETGLPWINPIGGFGDMLMLSGVMKLVVDRDPAKRFNLIRRTHYLSILKGHPAVERVGFPSKSAQIMGVDYWSKEKLGPGSQRAFQVLARVFGLPTPVEERLFLPNAPDDDPLLHRFIPWGKLNVLIAPSSESPRKALHSSIWHRVVDHLLGDGAFVMQAGRLPDQHIRNAFSLRGLTTPRQLIALIRKCDIVITADNFVMHAAHLAGTRAVVIWGPTDHRIYGYAGQIHIQMSPACGIEEGCIHSRENEGGALYSTPCPLGEKHCIDRAQPGEIYEAARQALMR